MRITTNSLYLIFALVTLCCFSLYRIAQAVTPAPDGGYPNFNTAEGDNALFGLTTGGYNTAIGYWSLYGAGDGSFNTGVGAAALIENDGNENTATGAGALLLNSTGAGNTADGAFALIYNSSSYYNTAVGDRALQYNTGGWNTAVGYQAGLNQTDGSFNVYIGQGMEGIAGELGHTYIRNINTTSVSGDNTDTVTVDLITGLLGHLSSSRRYKEDIKPMADASEALYRLKPVTYHYKKHIDPAQSPAFGLIAEEVANVNPALVARDAKGQSESIHYEMVDAMLLNEFLKEHRKVEQMEKQLEVLTARLQHVSEQLELSTSAARTVLNDK